MKKIIGILLTTYFVLNFTASSYSQELPCNPQGFYFERTTIVRGRQYSAYTIKEKDNKYELIYFEQDKKTRNLRFSRKISLRKSDLDDFIKILNYVDFINLKNHIRNNKRMSRSGSSEKYFLSYRYKNKKIKKRTTCSLLEFEASNQKEMYQLTFINLFLESKIRYRNNDGSIKYWR